MNTRTGGRAVDRSIEHANLWVNYVTGKKIIHKSGITKVFTLKLCSAIKITQWLSPFHHTWTERIKRM